MSDQVVTWVEPVAYERAGSESYPVEWAVRCDGCTTVPASRWTQERFALQAAESHRKAHDKA